VTIPTHDFNSEPNETFSHLNSASLPSPLLCPCRTFLASVILASKFSQDKCYSNQAWAKLLGLPPQEIGRCICAPGQALGWWLWVGKTLLSSPSHTPCSLGWCSTLPLKQIVRSQSEGSILIHSIPSQFLNQEKSPIDISVFRSQGRALRSCTTLPADAFVSQHHVASSVIHLGNRDGSSSLNNLANAVCTCYEQLGRTPEWISNSQVLISLILKGALPSRHLWVLAEASSQ
jgi:hypothetical protein